MIFSLEILQAKHGDCLLLHFGAKADPKLMVIDGGPSGVYNSFLKPRLLAIKNKRSPAHRLPISMIMVSHLDDDHANGICTLTDEMVSDGNQSPFTVRHLWVNTFDDILGNNQLPGTASITASANAAGIASLGLPGTDKLSKDEIAVIASTSQGRQLRDNAKTLTLAVNIPFKKLAGSDAVLVRSDASQENIPLDGLSITVVSPDQQRLKKLQSQWDKDLKRFKKNGDKSIITASLGNDDGSVFNLSSIACLVTVNGKSILLTGDGRSDYILEGLEKNSLLDAHKKLHVDVLKMPHHGSIRNMGKEFFQSITADHYVISADGRDDNPDKELLDLLLENVTSGTVYFTNKDGKNGLKKKMDAFEKELIKKKSKLKTKYLDASKQSMLIELGEKINF
ncbi:MAG: hypothetical protein ABI480_02800 [Chitinophagaceae bacterium]